ncbi:MAG: DUF2267 domain-containing protein [Myxococcaceae bacterium]|nr:DUF2267 domain-containing protein [Myxococcaceae bacterium]MCI0671241.1 DUF2267 domain-containing protein [Myxococcaceae bacterium]
MAERTIGQEMLERRIQRRDAHASETWGLFLKRLTGGGKLDKDFAERAAVTVMCTLEQRLSAGEAKDLESQLPMRLKEMLVRCPRHEGNATDKFSASEFVRRVAEDLEVDEGKAESAIRAVFGTLRTFVSDGEIADVEAQLPSDMRALWRLEA